MDKSKDEKEQFFEVFETAEVKRKYSIKAKSAQEALNKMYSGDFTPYAEDEENNEVWVYDKNGKVCMV